MSPYNFYSDNFQDFCKDNNLSESDGFKIVLEEINKLIEEKRGIL